MENGCEWRFHPSTMMAMAVYVLCFSLSVPIYYFRPILGSDITLNDLMPQLRSKALLSKSLE
jgi:hypothetical protein